jgi:monoamine oxidase
MRIVLSFSSAWWESNSDLADVGFWLSQERHFPTWWTALPMRVPILTGWSAGPRTDGLIGQTRETIIGHALTDLARVSGFDLSTIQRELQAVHFHDWHADPLARGAYSYVRAGGFAGRAPLAEPVENTLFFAGEATEINGHGGTVHGAIATGLRAAAQVMESFR